MKQHRTGGQPKGSSWNTKAADYEKLTTTLHFTLKQQLKALAAERGVTVNEILTTLIFRELGQLDQSSFNEDLTRTAVFMRTNEHSVRNTQSQIVE